MSLRRIDLPLSEMPDKWYNIGPDLPTPPDPPLHPGTKQPIGPQDMAPIFPMGLLAQEMSTDSWIEIPDEVRYAYQMYRPTPVYRAYELEKALDTPAHIYYKHEYVSPAGSHKPNTAIAQAFYNKQEGVKKIATETGAGQWGSALAMACKMFGLECEVFMVGVSFDQKPYRRILMETWGAKCVPSPSQDTEIGRKILAEDPNSPGTLGIAISEAIEDAFGRDDTYYSIGSVINSVLLHQTVIGQEAKKQMEMAGFYPDIIVGCIGGGSNFAGMFLPFVVDKVKGNKKDLRIINVEPEACPSITKGTYTWDYGDVAGLAPIVKMYTLGHTFMPPGIHAGGLRYHGMSPIISHLHRLGFVEAKAVPQVATFQAGVQFARTEGIVPAPEPNHAIRVAIDEALACKKSGESKTILIALSGHGHFDLGAYDEFLSGKLQDYAYPAEKVKEALTHLPEVKYVEA